MKVKTWSIVGIAIVVFSLAWALSTLTPVAAQELGATRSQTVGRIAVTLGMSESEVLRQLKEEFVVLPMSGAVGTYLIYAKGKTNQLVGSFLVSAGRVSNIETTWTPRADRGGAIGEVLFTLLTRLTAGNEKAGSWQTASTCSLSTLDGATVGTDTQLRMAEVACGTQKIRISVTRMDGGASQLSLQLVTAQ